MNYKSYFSLMYLQFRILNPESLINYEGQSR